MPLKSAGSAGRRTTTRVRNGARSPGCSAQRPSGRRYALGTGLEVLQRGQHALAPRALDVDDLHLESSARVSPGVVAGGGEQVLEELGILDQAEAEGGRVHRAFDAGEGDPSGLERAADGLDHELAVRDHREATGQSTRVFHAA